MPGTRIEIAEGLVAHLIELRIELNDLAIRIVVIDEDVVADAMSPRPPYQRDFAAAQKVAGLPDVVPITPFERDVMHLGSSAMHEVDGVMIGAAAQKRKKVAHPVRNAEAKRFDEKPDRALHVFNVESDVTEFDRPDSILWSSAWRLIGFVRQLDFDIFGANHRELFANARRGIAREACCDSPVREFGAKCFQIGRGVDAEGD